MPGPGALAVELERHRATCPSCRWGGPDGCAVALATLHALVAERTDPGRGSGSGSPAGDPTPTVGAK